MAIVAHSHPFVIGVDTRADADRRGVRDDGHGRSLFLPRDGAWSRSPSGRYRSGKRSLRGKSVMGHGPWVGQSPDEVTGGVGGADLLVALPGEQDFAVGVAAAQAVDQPVPLLVGQVVGASAGDVADPVERVTCVPAVTQGVLLDATTDLVEGLSG